MTEITEERRSRFAAEITDSDVDDDVHELLVKYSDIPANQVTKHLIDIRGRAWAIFPYGCIGQFRFARFTIHSYPAYPEVLERIRNGEKLLDLGCAMGQELRKVAYDGAPTENLYGSDLRMDFMDIGYDLFNDKNKLKAKFIAANVLDEASDLKQLDGKISIVFIGSFLHLFNYDGQFAIIKRIVSLLDRSKENLILGRQMGHQVAKEYPTSVRPGETATKFGHNPESFKQLWDRVGELTGTKWDVQAAFATTEPTTTVLYPLERRDGATKITFVVRRIP